MNYTILQVVSACILHSDACKIDNDSSKYITTADHVKHIKEILESDIDLPFDHAQEMIETIMHTITMNALTGKHMSDFLKNLGKILGSEPGTFAQSSNYGLLCYVPTVYEQCIEQSNFRIDLSNSEFTGEPTNNVIIDLRIAQCKSYKTDFGNVIKIVAFDKDGHAYTFSSTRVYTPSQEYSVKVKAKIKKHEVNKYLQNAKTTVLWYVRQI